MFPPQAQVIAQAIGQAFAVAYQQFLQTNGMKPDEYDDFLSTQELYNGDLVHFSRSENIREVRWLCSPIEGEVPNPHPKSCIDSQIFPFSHSIKLHYATIWHF